MTGHVKVSGAFKEMVSGSAVKVSGAWKEISNGYVKVSGVWKQFFVNTVFTLSGQACVTVDGSSPYDTTTTLRVDSDGNVYEGNSTNGAAVTYTQIDTTTDWIRPTTGATSYYVRYSGVTGTFSGTPGTVNTAIAMTVDREWSINNSSLGAATVSFTLEILDTDQSTVLATGSYSLLADNIA